MCGREEIKPAGKEERFMKAEEQLKEWIEDCSNIRVFRRSGVSTESGIPDFRSTDGLYHQEWKYPPEVILSHTFYESNPEEFFRFYKNKMLFPKGRAFHNA